MSGQLISPGVPEVYRGRPDRGLPAHNWEEWDRSQDYRFRFKELAIVKMIRVIEENQCGVFFRVEFAAMEKALTVKSGLSN
ncbi:hypothetical protein GQQ23_02705 [Pantoea agglomerans]|nr:hypothetical protein [Pantoea agglomerans]